MGKGDNIKIFLRLRPTKRENENLLYLNEYGEALEVSKGESEIEASALTKVRFRVPRSTAVGNGNNDTVNTFAFDRVLGMKAKQDEVFNMVARESVQSALEGFNATIFAYGQTGSGKTFTITGGAERYVDRGIIPRTLTYIFNEIAKRSDAQYKIHVSYLEIYNGAGYDLLDPTHEVTALEDMPKVMLREDDGGNVHISNLSMHLADTEEDGLNLLFVGDTNRAIAETPMNMASSRSHCVFTIFFEARQPGSDVIRRSKLHLVDLAGSERTHKTNSTGQIFKEANYINTSLSFLEQVIIALHEKATKGRQHIPYRNSLLTSILRDSLGGNCKTSMVANISADAANTGESISTCRFAQRVALIKNQASLNEQVDPSMVIRRLKAEVRALKDEIAFLKGEAGEDDEIDGEEMERLKSVVQGWIRSRSSENLQPGGFSFNRIHACFRLLRDEAASGAHGKAAGPPSDGEIAELKGQLQQRDNEISILVNMVKEARRGGGIKIARNDDEDADNVGGVPPYSEMQKNAQERQRARDVREHAPRRRSITLKDLEDKKKALKIFRETYAKNQAVEDNKVMLKTKYNEAKQTGEVINAARTKINELKAALDDARAARQEVDPDDLDLREERMLRNEKVQAIKVRMDEHKQTYRSNFQKLRELKGEIERIQKLLEKSRVTMQEDFEAWRGVMLRQCERSEPVQPSFVNSERAVASPQSHPVRQSSGFRDYTRTQEVASMEAEPPSKAQSAWGSPRNSSRHEPPPPQDLSSSSTMPLTGNAEADADIRAFYAAKEKLMSQRYNSKSVK